MAGDYDQRVIKFISAGTLADETPRDQGGTHFISADTAEEMEAEPPDFAEGRGEEAEDEEEEAARHMGHEFFL